MGLIGTIRDLLHARILSGVDGAPSLVTGPDDRHEVDAPRPVDSNRPAVDRADSQAAWDAVLEQMSENAANVERVCEVIGAINVALDELDRAYAHREHGGVAQMHCIHQIRRILIAAGYRL